VIALLSISIVWLLWAGAQSHSGVDFDWDSRTGFAHIDACPYSSGVSRIIVSPYCYLIAMQAKPLIRGKFQRNGWHAAKGHIFVSSIWFLPIVIRLDEVADWRIIDPEETPLMQAAEKGDALRIKELLVGGANVNARDQRGYTALMYASMSYHDSAAVVKILVLGGADVNARDKSGNTALSWAVWSGIRLEAARELIASGADVNARDGFGNPILFDAVGSGGDEKVSAEAVKLLINSGADVNLTDSHGENALALAQRIHSDSIVQLLKQARAND
jgi:hypothetical protein